MGEIKENLQLSAIVTDALQYHMRAHNRGAGISIPALSRRTGISESTISAHRSRENISVPELNTIMIYACVLGEGFLNDILETIGFGGVVRLTGEPAKDGLALIELGTRMVKEGTR